MGTITLPNFRTTADVKMDTKLKDGGVYIEWSSLTDIKAWIWSDAQKALAGRVDVSVDEGDATVLKCLYASSKPQYLGINRLIVQGRYNGSLKTYDKPVFNFVPRTAEANGAITISDPEMTVEIEVTDTTSSILDNTIAAALAAAAHAEHAASLVPLQVLQDCEVATAVALTAASKAPVIGENGHWWVWNSQQAAYVDTGKQAKGDTGNGIASFSVVESEEDDGENVITVVFTDGEEETFTVKNGKTGNGIASIAATESQADDGVNVVTVTMTNGTTFTFNVRNGSKGTTGEPGASNAKYKQVDTLPTASADTMEFIYLTPTQTADVYDMSYTEQDGDTYTWKGIGTTAIQLSQYAKNEAVDGKLDKQIGTNLLDVSKAQTGKYISTSGTISSGTDTFAVSDYIPVNGKDIISTAISETYAASFNVYDSSKTRLRTVVQNTQYTYQQGDAYIRICFRTYGDPRANYGTTLANYEPYTDYSPVLNLDKRTLALEKSRWCYFLDSSPTKLLSFTLTGSQNNSSVVVSLPQGYYRIGDSVMTVAAHTSLTASGGYYYFVIWTNNGFSIVTNLNSVSSEYLVLAIIVAAGTTTLQRVICPTPLFKFNGVVYSSVFNPNKNDIRISSLLPRNPGTNLFDISAASFSKYISSDGSVYDASSASFFVSDYIPVNGKSIVTTAYTTTSNIASYNVYDEEGKLLRTVVQNVQYTYQQGDAYIRFCGVDNGAARANYGTTLADFEPYVYSPVANLERRVDALENIVLAEVLNGTKTVLATNNMSFWRGLPDSEHYSPQGMTDEYFYYTTYPGNADTFVRMTDLTPDMGGTLKIKAKITNIGDNDAYFSLWVSPDQDYHSDGSTFRIVDRQPIRQDGVFNLEFDLDCANLTVYHGYTTKVILWWQVVLGSNTQQGGSTLKFEDVEVSQAVGATAFANIEGDNVKELFQSVDEKLSESAPGNTALQFITGPSGDKYLLSANSQGALVLIPLFPDNVYYIGNSLLLGSGFGMAASDSEHDYFYRLNQFFASKVSGTLTTDRITVSSFERAVSLAAAKTEADTIISGCPSAAKLVFVQCGDNVNSSNYETIFRPALEYLVSGLRNKAQGARVILFASWYGNVVSIMQDVAKKYGCTFVEIVSLRGASKNSYLGAVQTFPTSASRTVTGVTNVTEGTPDAGWNYKLNVTFEVSGDSYNATVRASAYSLSDGTLSYTSDQGVVQTSGVASHPGDEGFRLITNKILHDGGFVDTDEYYTE